MKVEFWKIMWFALLYFVKCIIYRKCFHVTNGRSYWYKRAEHPFICEIYKEICMIHLPLIFRPVTRPSTGFAPWNLFQMKYNKAENICEQFRELWRHETSTINIFPNLGVKKPPLLHTRIENLGITRVRHVQKLFHFPTIKHDAVM